MELGEMMKIIVLNGSPKGDLSLTLQYVKYINRHFTEVKCSFYQIGHEIKKIENNPEYLHRILSEVQGADAVLWVSPVYARLIPSQLKRFIELVFASDLRNVFWDKYCAGIFSSVHFYDETAMNYIHAISEDLKMKYYGGYSAGMNDIEVSSERQRLCTFFAGFYDTIERKRALPHAFPPVVYQPIDYVPANVLNQGKDGSKKVLVLTDAGRDDHNLTAMTETMVQFLHDPVEIINIRDIGIKGGCLGCIRCGYDGHCAYEHADGFVSFFEEKMLGADAIIYAGTIKDRYLSALWKQFFDREFYKCHQPVLTGKHSVYLISGPLGQNANIRHALTHNRGESVVGFVTDEVACSEELTAQLQSMASRLEWAMQNEFDLLQTFSDFGGGYIFRELVGGSRTIFRSDHRYYKKHGLYHPTPPVKPMNFILDRILLCLLYKFPKVRRQIQAKNPEVMISHFKKDYDSQS